MIISRTPFRVSLFGGGTDYPAWYQENGGATLGMAIDKYAYLSVRYLPPFFEHRHRIVYAKIETVRTVEEIQHPAVRAILARLQVEKGLEIHYDGDLPARSGIGSSSSFTVGLLNALHALQGRVRSKRELAEEAIHVEQVVMGETVGCQDQIWAAYGGLNRIDFNVGGGFSVRPLVIHGERIQALLEHTVLYFTGQSRIASHIAQQQVENIPARQANLRTLHTMVDEAEDILTNGRRSLDDLGRLLHEGWQLKRGMAAGVATGQVDEIYQAGLDAGAMGGKLLGAGGGGFVLFYVRPEHQERLRDRLHTLIEIKFQVDRGGSKIVLYSPHGLGES